MNSSNSKFLIPTPMLDFNHDSIQKLISINKWDELPDYEKIGAIYSYVRDNIFFGYNADDQLSASQVLQDGYGQCNTKGTLLMALLRAVNIPCRIHGFTIYNSLQKGAIPAYIIPIAPKRIIHSWVEVLWNEEWINLEGYILDKPYLQKIQHKFQDQSEGFSGFGIATKCLSNPPIEWEGKSTYIQNEGIADDFGIFTNPDDFYKKYGSNVSGIRKIFYKFAIRHLINRNVQKIRSRELKRNDIAAKLL